MITKAERLAQKSLKRAAKAKMRYRRQNHIEGLFFSGYNERTYDLKALEKEVLQRG